MSSWHFLPVGGYGTVIGIAVLFLAVLVWISPDVRRLAPRRHVVLLALRVAVFLAIIAAMLRPTYVFTQMKKHRATLIVLADRSRSMSINDETGSKTRWQLLRETVDRALPALRGLGEDLDVKLYTFDADLTPIDLNGDKKFDLGEIPDGRETAIGAAMNDALRREAGHRLAGMILLSDGAQNALYPRDEAPQTPARFLAEQGVPLYTVVFGQAGTSQQRRDVAVTELDVSPTVFVKNELVIRGTVRISGYTNQDVPVQALFETEPGKPPEVIGAAKLRAVSDGQELPIEFSYIPQTPGERKVTLRVEPQPGEQDVTNNELSSFVKVFGGGLNVFYLEGELRVEQRFLRRALASSPDIKVDFEWIDHRMRKKWPVDLADRFKPGKYDVYIIGDLDSKAFRPEDLQALRQDVDRGAGLIMLGGFHSFWSGGYQDTALRDILPLEVGELDKFDRQNFDEPIREKLHIQPANRDIGLKMLPDRRFGDVSIMRLGPKDKNRAIWERLPGLQGANLFRALKPAAKPLAFTPDGKPLLVAAEPGAGRVLAFAGDSTWLWAMAGFEKEHKQFWRQVILWLAKKEDSDTAGVWIKLGQRQYTPGRPVNFSVGATSAQNEPVPEATFAGHVLLPDGSQRPVHFSRQGTQTLALFKDTQLPGDYSIVVSASDGATALGETRARFIVYDLDLEMENSAPRPALMESLAQTTRAAGGERLSPEELPQLCERLKKLPHELEVPVETKETPWDKPYFLLLIVGLLSTEWFFRKKWGLV
jgi:uncharacterized membrane protein